MLRTRWQKVLTDLWKNRGRTLVVALAIAVGVYAMGVVLFTREILVREYRSDQQGSLPASAVLHTYPFDGDLAERIAQIPGVAAAEGRSLVRASTQDAAGKRVDIVLVAVPDLAQMRLDAVTPLQGSWPPGRREVVLERQSPAFLGAGIGDELSFELEGGAVKQLKVVGTAHDAQQVSPDISDTASGYISLETLQGLGLPVTHTELRVRVAEQGRDKEHVLSVVRLVEDQLRLSHRPVLSRTVVTESVADPFIDTVVLILTSFGLIILILSGFLVVNAMSALITQQIPQIGIMKLIGARRGQVMSMYLVTVLVYGILAVAVAVPTSLLTGRLLMTAMVNNLLNIMPESYRVPPYLLAIQAVAGLLLPVVAGLAPVVRGMRITTHRALNDVGIQAGSYGLGLAERLIARLRQLRAVQRPFVLSLRNTLRHKGRLAQTLVVLTLGTALFVSVMSTRSSVNATLESFMRFHGYDVSVELARPERTVRLEQVARAVPSVVDVEVWSQDTAVRQRADGTESDPFRVVAVPAATRFVQPELMAGAWLDAGPHDLGGAGESAPYPLVVNSELVDDEADLQVGASVRLEMAGREATWQIVGIVPTEARGPLAYVALSDYGYLARTPDQGTRLMVATQRHDAAAQHETATILMQQLLDRGIESNGSETTQSMRTGNKLMFTIVVAFLILMALLLAAVGGLGLTTTMSINIMERVREIGVLRAIGASNGAVRRIVLAEGLAMGLLSWVVGTLISLPLSPFLARLFGIALIQMPLTYQYSTPAALAWLLVLQAIAVVATLGPARRAERLTIREVLAYE